MTGESRPSYLSSPSLSNKRLEQHTPKKKPNIIELKQSSLRSKTFHLQVSCASQSFSLHYFRQETRWSGKIAKEYSTTPFPLPC